MKFKESIRRGFIPNEIQEITKIVNLEDNKRYWNSTFNYRGFQESRPIKVIDGVTEQKLFSDMLKAQQDYERNKEKDMKKFINSDLFDSNSVGFDISEDEFLENEKYFAKYE